MRAGESAASVTTLDRALASPEISARHPGRLLVLAARTHCHLGEAEKASRVGASALAAATEAGDSWAMGWALHVLTLATTTQGHLTDALPLFDRALAVTESDPALTDLRLLLQIHQAITLAASTSTTRPSPRRVGPGPRGPGRHHAPAGPGTLCPGPAAVRNGTMGRGAGRAGDSTRGPEGTRCGLRRARHRRSDRLPPRPDRHVTASPGRGRAPRQADRKPPHQQNWPWPAAWTASRPARCRRRWPR